MKIMGGCGPIVTEGGGYWLIRQTTTSKKNSTSYDLSSAIGRQNFAKVLNTQGLYELNKSDLIRQTWIGPPPQLADSKRRRRKNSMKQYQKII